MQIVAFIFAIAASVGFAIEAVHARSTISAALTSLTIAWIVQTCILTGTHIT